MFDHANWMFGGGLTMLLIWLAPLFLLFFALKNFLGNRPPTARELFLGRLEAPKKRQVTVARSLARLRLLDDSQSLT